MCLELLYYYYYYYYYYYWRSLMRGGFSVVEIYDRLPNCTEL